MLPLLLTDGTRPLRVLALGAHCDDIEIGAGATLGLLAQGGYGTEIECVVLSATDERAAETTGCLRELCAPLRPAVTTYGLPDGRMPGRFDEVKDILGEWARGEWDVVLTHHRFDAHQDHRMLGELVPTAFRDHLVLQFEVPKWDGDLGTAGANVYVPLATADIGRKWAALDRHHVSQRHHDWWQEETFRALGRLRGMECRAAYAEAFRVDKARLELWPAGD